MKPSQRCCACSRSKALALAAGVCANRGLVIAADLAGEQHFAGPARKDADGNFYVQGPDGTLCSGSFLWSDNLLWRDSLAQPVGINVWVPQD
jgi:hypothetical protein